MKYNLKLKKSRTLGNKFHETIPGGCHTYAKGDDQYPTDFAPILVRGKGCHVWDVDGNKYIEYGMGLRSVTLGHAYKPVLDAAYNQMQKGENFVRPATMELECAQMLQSVIKSAEMVKFGKNGSDVTSAAIRLSRAYTGRDYVAICGDHPFFSVDDWFIGTTPMSAGIGETVRELTLQFKYNNIQSLESLFENNPGKIACVMLEPEKSEPPLENYLQKVKEICQKHGAVLIFDEMITGFRWHLGGAQEYYNVMPDLSTFGKGLANGFSVSALVGKKEIMELGGIRHKKERVFILSLTHGAEGHSLAAAQATVKIFKKNHVVETLWQRGKLLKTLLAKSIKEQKLEENVPLIGKHCCLLYGSRDQEGKPSQPFRTLFLQETIKRGLLAPSLVVCYSHSEKDIIRTSEIISEALYVYRKALDQGVEKYLTGRAIKPVWRKYN
jgi:glutamate-1-semialdehyde 2,1-aminomutase